MDPSTIKSLASGALFGAAITAAGVYSPAVIVGQMKFQDFHMLKAFLAASASSAIAILISRQHGLSTCKPRSPAQLGLLYGNLLGGLLLGAGMTLTGACPGTLLPQVATGVRSGPLVLLGGLLGGILWSRYKRSRDFVARRAESIVQSKSKSKSADQKPTTASELVGVSEAKGLAVYETMCLGILGAAIYFAPEKREVLLPPVVGGLLIGASQFASLALTGNVLGISGAYEEVGDYFWSLLSTNASSKPENTRPPLTCGSLIFASGTVLGCFVLSQIVQLPLTPEVDISALRAIGGGAIMLFGSRLAGGCTSGHGISGMSMLSISSFVSVAAMFIGGMGVAAFIG